MEKTSNALQQSLPGLCEVENALNILSGSSAESRGAIFTRPEVVEFILDLVGYSADEPLHEKRLLEPSFGEGDFLSIVVHRLLDSVERSGLDEAGIVGHLRDCIFGVELHIDSYNHTAEKLASIITERGYSKQSATQLVAAWLHQGDFLLADLGDSFTHVVGNPPYLRQEMIPDALIAEYRRRFQTIYDRADLYVPFIEKSLLNLGEQGQLGFICADRWMKNRYGKKLRHLVAEHFRLITYVDMVGTQAFMSDVTAYPAVFVIARQESGPTRVALRPSITSRKLQTLSKRLRGNRSSRDVHIVSSIGNGDEPWLLDRPDELELVRRIESHYPTLEDAGCKVGIGVATGADQVFIAPFDEMDVEPDRKLPIVMTRDIRSGEVKYRGMGVVNPFRDEGGLVQLDDYPKLKRFFEERRDQILKRHVSKKNPKNWYRTIDRIYPALASKPKLLIPDIKGDAHVVYEDGKYYPHHNLYYVTSDEWNIRALQAVLSSGIARLFVSLYSTQMRGGYLRFQAQYLRRIRVPKWGDIDPKLQTELIRAGKAGDVQACNSATAELYQMSASDQALIVRQEAEK